MANQVDQVVDSIGNIIVPLVQELLQSPLLIQNSEGKTEASVWEAVEAWKDNTALPMKVHTHTHTRRARAYYVYNRFAFVPKKKKCNTPYTRPTI